jgi:hypothetical protein
MTDSTPEERAYEWGIRHGWDLKTEADMAEMIRAAVEAEREPLLDVIESCFAVGEIRFGTNGLAQTVRAKVVNVLVEAGRIDALGAAIRAREES